MRRQKPEANSQELEVRSQESEEESRTAKFVKRTRFKRCDESRLERAHRHTDAAIDHVVDLLCA